MVHQGLHSSLKKVYLQERKNMCAVLRQCTKNSVLKAIYWNSIHSIPLHSKFHGNSSPSTATWWGGWRERMVWMLKELLRWILGRRALNSIVWMRSCYQLKTFDIPFWHARTGLSFWPPFLFQNYNFLPEVSKEEFLLHIITKYLSLKMYYT